MYDDFLSTHSHLLSSLFMLSIKIQNSKKIWCKNAMQIQNLNLNLGWFKHVDIKILDNIMYRGEISLGGTIRTTLPKSRKVGLHFF
jgi:hypothetical protein